MIISRDEFSPQKGCTTRCPRSAQIAGPSFVRAYSLCQRGGQRYYCCCRRSLGLGGMGGGTGSPRRISFGYWKCHRTLDRCSRAGRVEAVFEG
ncbi:hypothetical protein K443DRAFT_611870 [Laccaria amethystina LaAM-08-1]|uniref:Uncharacterized protein n=1 Tax=Laccaria amethystina LaAM-08-1 TaxID=1095629 RepID=A0A0C9X5V9_9AGAR|nr:hypothetical protein K443DRAFT_611870 [Laccaria amethystina LaAM-08-1]